MNRLWICLLATATPALAQDDDLRDLVRLTNGHELRGRVQMPYGPESIRMKLEDGRIDVPRSDIAGSVTVNDHLREFFARLDRHSGNETFTRVLMEWAASKQLPGMARLLALDLVLRNDDPRAHELLGHRRRSDRWLWSADGRWVTREKYDEHITDMGHPLELVGEHFRLKTDGGLRRAVDALLDLERAYLLWVDLFGKELQLREALQPMEIQIWADPDSFPKITGRRVAYYKNRSSGEYGVTWFPTTGAPAERLLTVAAQAMLERTLVTQRGDGGADFKDHPCAWAEMGLAQWFEAQFAGLPGRRSLRAPILAREAIQEVLGWRPRLQNVTHLRYGTFLEVSERTPMYWAATWAFVHYLMDPRNNRRESFLRFCRAAFYEGVGDSSSELDKALGAPIEVVAVRFYEWLDAL